MFGEIAIYRPTRGRMDGWIDGWMDGWMDGWKDGLLNE